MKPAPVALFAFRRPDHLAKVVAGLLANSEAAQTQLWVFCDGAKGAADVDGVAAVRRFARAIKGFAGLTVVERSENFGLARSIREGVSQLCASDGRVVVLEDDVVPTPFFLAYVNAGLERYADDARVISIGCYTYDGGRDLPPTFFLNIPDCWGWAVWARSWAQFEPDGTKLLAALTARGRLRSFDFDGAYPYTKMLKDQIAGGNASWAILWYAHAALTGQLTIYPHRSVTSNIGQDGSGTHGGKLEAGPLILRLADSPVDVLPILVEECASARRAWTECLSAAQGTRLRRASYSVRHRLSRMTRARLR